MICEFCKKQCKSRTSLIAHTVYCKSNPQKRTMKPSYGMLGKKGSNHFSKARRLGLPDPITTEITKQKISDAAKISNKNYWARAGIKEKHSRIMKEVFKNNPESYLYAKRGRTKIYEVDGIKLQGTWEVAFYNYCKFYNITITKNHGRFLYTYENKEYGYYPDFYLKDLDVYVEVKGVTMPKDLAKWKCFPKKLIVITSKEIQYIRDCKPDVIKKLVGGEGFEPPALSV